MNDKRKTLICALTSLTFILTTLTLLFNGVDYHWLVISIFGLFGVKFGWLAYYFGKDTVDTTGSDDEDDDSLGYKLSWDDDIDLDVPFKVLKETNLRLRLSNVSKDTGEAVEKLIDDLRFLLPKLYEGHKEHVLTWKLNQVAIQFLPNLVDEYLTALSVQDQVPDDTLKSTVTKLRQRTTEIKDELSNNRTQNFERYAQTLDKVLDNTN